MNKMKILVPVDGSDQSFEAIRYIGSFSTLSKALVSLYHVTRPALASWIKVNKKLCTNSISNSVEKQRTYYRKKITRFMEDASQYLIRSGIRAQNIQVVINKDDHKASRAIRTEILNGYDAVVLGRNGINSEKNPYMGSVAHDLANMLYHNPLWVVDGLPNPGKILIALDQSENSMRALKYAGEIIRSNQAEIILLNVNCGAECMGEDPRKLDAPNSKIRFFENRKTDAATIDPEMIAAFQKSEEILRQMGIESSRIRKIVVQGKESPATAILEKAHSEECDTIVVGRKGLSNDNRYFMGSVCNEVLFKAKGKAIWLIN